MSVISTWPSPIVDGPSASTAVPARMIHGSSTSTLSSRLPTTTTPAATAAFSTIAAPRVVSGVIHARAAISAGQTGGHTVTGSSRK